MLGLYVSFFCNLIKFLQNTPLLQLYIYIVLMSQSLIVSLMKFVLSRKNGNLQRRQTIRSIRQFKESVSRSTRCPFCCQLKNLPDEVYRRRSRSLCSVRSMLRRTLAVQVPLPLKRSEYVSLYGITVL